VAGGIAFSPADPNVAWACRSSLMKSTDGGVTFLPVSTPGHADLVAPHPTDPTRLLMAWGYDDLSYEAPFFTTYLYTTTNQGSTWSKVFTSTDGNQRPTGLAWDEADPTVCHLGMTGQNGPYAGGRSGFHRSEAGGASQSWHPAMEGIGNSSAGRVTVDPRGAIIGRGRWLGWWGYEYIFLITTDAGRTWEALPSHGYIQCGSGHWEANRRDPGLLWSVGYCFAIDFGVGFAYRSRDFGQTWQPPQDPPAGLPRPWEATGPGFRAVTTNHGSGSTVYVWENTSFSNTPLPLYRSDDGGDNFQYVTAVAGFRDAVVDPTSDLRVVVAAETAPLVRASEDGGATWSALDTGLPAGKAFRVLMDPTDPDRMVVAFELSPPHRSTDGGLSWTALPVDPAGDFVVDADWNPRTGEVFVAMRASGLVSSVSGSLNDGLGTRQVLGIRYSEGDHALLAGTANGGIRRMALPEPAMTEGFPAAPAAPARGSRLAVRAVPNPAGDGAIRVELAAPRDAAVEVTVFDVTGRRVRTLTPDLTRGVVEWDGRDESGRRAAAGVYLVRLRSGGESVTARVSLVR
jgi:hypothetical protein